MLTKVFEKFLTLTIILGIPSKILGAILGVLQYLIYTFIILYILSLPTFNLSIVNESKTANTILNKTPILNKVCDDTLDTFNEIIKLKDEYKTTNNMDEFNQKALNVMIEKGKIKNVTIE